MIRFGRALAIAVLLAPAWASGSPTDPVLALTGAGSARGAGLVLVQLEGSFPGADLVQLNYPLQILIRETSSGSGYVRFDLSGTTVSGSAAELADGLDADEALALLGQGAPAPDAQVVHLGLHRLEVTLPGSFPSGGAAAQLFVVDEGEVILSNPIPFVIGGLP
jgi:hypothetical protein